MQRSALPTQTTVEPHTLNQTAQKILHDCDAYIDHMDQVGKPVDQLALYKKQYDTLSKAIKNVAEKHELYEFTITNFRYREIQFTKHAD